MRDSTPDFDAKTFHASRLFGLILTIGIVVSFFIFQHDINNWVNQFTDEANNSSSTALSPQKKSAPAKIVTKPPTPVSKPATTLVEKLKQRNLARPPEANTASTVKPVLFQSETAVKQEPKIDNALQATVDIAAIPRKESWILNQNSSHYTLQIVAGENLKTIEEFIAEHKLYNNIAFYRSVRKNKPWYGLIYGVYPHKQAATSAINQLSNKLQRLKPWVRGINSIKNDIYKTRP